MGKKVVIGMSGGVDSSVAAYLLKEQGYDVIGVMMKLSDPPTCSPQKKVSCCSAEDASDARQITEQLGIPFYVINAKQAFKEAVIDEFVQEYLAGRTPNPCVRCNDTIKFGYFYQEAKQLGADFIATGHYIRKEWDEGTQRWRLFKSQDQGKDQSYFLFSMTQDEIAHTLFPIGHLEKSEVREIARKLKMKTSEKKESQEICFVPDHGHAAFIDQYLGEKKTLAGEIHDLSGNKIGDHEGVYHFTLGQRRGTQVAKGERLYVQSIDAEKRLIRMGPDASLYAKGLRFKDYREIARCESGKVLDAKLRYRHEGAKAKLIFLENGEGELVFDEPQRAITPGQAVVFYDDAELLGGAWIKGVIFDEAES